MGWRVSWYKADKNEPLKITIDENGYENIDINGVMIHDELVTYEVAKLAKEKGFDEPTEMYYHISKNVEMAQDSLESTGYGRTFYNSLNVNRCSAPTQSLLQRWLREEKKIHIEIYPVFSSSDKVKYGRWIVADAITMKIPIEYFDTYEQALEDAELYCLKNLL